jgi:hypothetical protein
MVLALVSDQTVLSPTTIHLIAGTSIHLETRTIAFLGLNFSDEVSLLEIFGLNAHFFRYILHFRHFHGQSPFQLS